jgi:alkaline phosphatase
MRIVLIAVFISLISNSMSPDSPPTGKEDAGKPQNVILLIGNGLGLTQLSTLSFKKNEPFAFENFPVTGLHFPYSLSELSSDLAAANTALSCGIKTKDGFAGIDESEIEIANLFELAKQERFATALCSPLFLSAPANLALYGHLNTSSATPNQMMQQFVDAPLDFYIGPGFEDNALLKPKLLARGVATEDGISLSNNACDKNSPLAVILSPDNQKKYYDQSIPYALECLSKKADKKGYLLIANYPEIDAANRAGNIEALNLALKAFQQDVELALNQARKDASTLLIVTGDRESGGLAINPGSTVDSLIPEFVTTSSTASMIPVFAYGPGSESFSGAYENSSIPLKIRKLLDIE